MKKIKFYHFLVITLAILSFCISCEKDENENSSINQPPTCTISNPSNGNQINQGESLMISANAEDSDGTITDVRFFVDNNEVGSTDTYPYEFEWSTVDVSFGIHSIKATAYDDEGANTSDEITVEIIDGSACDGITEFEYGGQTYYTVGIGDQCWMKENLNYETGNSWCYENDPANCVTYGRLYDWETALSVCPSGWHLPTDDEWKTLEGTVDSQYPVGDPEWDDGGGRGFNAGKNLKSNSGWNYNGNGGDLYGFTALPGGGRYENGLFEGRGDYGAWWSSGEESTNIAWYRWFYFDDNQSHRNTGDKNYGFSVRCLRD